MKKIRLQPYSGLYIDLSGLPDRYRDRAREEVKLECISIRVISSSFSLNVWSMFACQGKAHLIWTEDDGKLLSYYRLISRYLTSEMKDEKAELEMKHVLVFGEIYPPSNRAMIEAYGADDEYSLYHKMENVMDRETGLNDSQRTQLLLLYKSKLLQLGDEAFFDDFDNIRRECYSQMGINLEEMEAMEMSKAASKLGKHGGKSTSGAKSQAAKENGRKGGRKKSTNQPSNQLGLSLEDI